MRSLVALLSLTALVACGDSAVTGTPDASTSAPDGGIPDSGPPDAGSGLDEDGCRILTVGRSDFQFNLFGQVTGLRYPVTPNLDDSAADFLLIELYDSTTGDGLPALAPGTFDLAAPGNDNLATCQHCLWVRVDESPDGISDAIYYQTKGELTLDSVSDPFEVSFSGSTSRVVLHRATVTDEGRSVLEQDGDCVSITGVSFDTAPSPGRECLSAEDCGNALLEVCDPSTNTCVPPQCGEFLSCPSAEHVCVAQYRDAFFGGCYQSCDPSATSVTQCGTEQRCVQLGLDPTFGLCKYVGAGEVGTTCETTDNGTSCGGDAVCSFETLTCSPSCRFFDATSNCPTGNVCSLFGVCEPPSIGSAAVIGAPCAPTDELGTGCGSDGESLRGICFAYEPEPLVCEKACLGDLGCGAGEFCALRFSSGLGVCRPQPVCGDGELGEIDEVCDDGNTVSGDGCSSDCRTVEYDVICSTLPALALGSDVGGDTKLGRDGFQSSCQLGIARASLFELTPPGPGRLTLSLTSPTNQTLALRSACADPAAELSCAERGDRGESEQIVFQVTDPNPAALTAVVSAFTVLEEGPFTVRADFVAEQCGDGVVAGNEVCDDGNTISNDGCSGDCREVEYDFYCATAPELSMGINTGDNTGAPDLFHNRCSAESGINSGPDRLYHYVAPANGTLHLLLESPTFLVVAVLDSCGPPSEVTELACNPTFTLGDIDLPMTAGQRVTVYVDGFLPDDEGTYTLTASFTAQ